MQMSSHSPIRPISVGSGLVWTLNWSYARPPLKTIFCKQWSRSSQEMPWPLNLGHGRKTLEWPKGLTPGQCLRRGSQDNGANQHCYPFDSCGTTPRELWVPCHGGIGIWLIDWLWNAFGNSYRSICWWIEKEDRYWCTVHVYFHIYIDIYVCINVQYVRVQSVYIHHILNNMYYNSAGIITIFLHYVHRED